MATVPLGEDQQVGPWPVPVILPPPGPVIVRQTTSQVCTTKTVCKFIP
jgi:hypothetical protein